MSDKPFAGTIENWYITDSLFSTGKLVNGNLFGDPMKRFEEGAFIHTSLVVKLDEEKGLLETRNSLYSLGVKDVVAQERYDQFINSK